MNNQLPSPFPNSNFYGAPVSKGLLLAVGLSHGLSHLPSLAPYYKKFFSVSPAMLSSWSGLLRILPTKLIFSSTRDTIFALYLLYAFRIFEKRYGSLKFASSLLATFTIGTVLELLSAATFGVLRSGPLSLVIPLFVPFYFHVPPTSSSSLGPLTISNKALTYMFGAQLMNDSAAHLIASICSLLAGAYYLTPKRLMLPGWLGRLSGLTLGRLVGGAAGRSDHGHLIGATLEIQREQQMEAIEQQMLRANRYRLPVVAGERQWTQQQQQEVPAGLVQTLVDMGFSRQRAERALRETNGNLDEATNLLLHDM